MLAHQHPIYPKYDSCNCSQQTVRDTRPRRSASSRFEHGLMSAAIPDPGFSPLARYASYSAFPCCKYTMHSCLPQSSRPYGTWNTRPVIGLTVRQSCPPSTIASRASVAPHWLLGVRSRASHEINRRWTPAQGRPEDNLGKRFSHANPAPVQTTRGARHTHE